MTGSNYARSIYRLDRSILSESFNQLSSAVSEIIRGQNSFLKKEILRYLPTGSDILKMKKMN
jgi:hypothetical protein